VPFTHSIAHLSTTSDWGNPAVENAFGTDIDYARLQKIYGAPSSEEQRRYSPAHCIGCDLEVVSGDPNPAHVSTSYMDRQNLSMRMGVHRFARLTNGFSKKGTTIST